MKAIIFRHYLIRSLKEPIGIGIVTGMPTVLIIVMTLVTEGMANDPSTYMVNGYNMVASSLAPMFLILFQFIGGNVMLDYIHEDFRGDRRWRMFSMPVTANRYILGILSACILYSVIQGALVIGISAFFLHAYWGNIFILFLTLFACAAFAQLLWMLLFLLVQKKGTIEAIAQCIIWIMMIASGYLTSVSGGAVASIDNPVMNFLSIYGTPVSLANHAITNSGFIGNDLDDAMLSVGILYAFVIVFAGIVFVVGKKVHLSPEIHVHTNPEGPSTPPRQTILSKFENFFDNSRFFPTRKAHDDSEILDSSIGSDELILKTPTDRSTHMTIYKFALLRAVRSPMSLLFNAILPLGLMFFGILWSGEETLGFSLLGLALMYGSFAAARGILNDRLDGSIIRIFASPVTNFQYLTQNLLAILTPLAIQITAIGFLGMRLYDWEPSFAIRVVLLYFLFAMACVSFSFAWSCLFKDRETSNAMFSVLMMMIALIGGFFIPLNVMPSILRYLGALFPAYWVSNGILILQGWNGGMGDFWLTAAVLLLFSVLYIVFGMNRRMIS